VSFQLFGHRRLTVSNGLADNAKQFVDPERLALQPRAGSHGASMVWLPAKPLATRWGCPDGGRAAVATSAAVFPDIAKSVIYGDPALRG
jgi:hypothetical protein